MDENNQFRGFPKEAVKFLKDLAKNNNTKWFQAHKAEFDEHIMAPSRAFVVEMGQRLKAISKGIEADPRVNGSLFRINRDTRFSADKTPYKTNIGIFFWEGPGKRMECPGFYFHLDADSLTLGTGIYMFPKPMLETYREAVVSAKLGPELSKAVKAVGDEAFDKSCCGVAAERYARVPGGYDHAHPRAELLKNKGLVAGLQSKLPPELYRADLVDYCYDRFGKLAPLHHWLVKMLRWPL